MIILTVILILKILFQQLMKGNSALSKFRYYVNKKILRTVFCAIFDSYLCHYSMGTGKNSPKTYNSPSEQKH